MGAFASVIAGIATIGGAVALARVVRKKANALRDELELRATKAGGGPGGPVIDYEQDPDDGVYRAKP